jgi:hypothetical protein
MEQGRATGFAESLDQPPGKVGKENDVGVKTEG